MNKQQLANKIWESANRMRSKIEANEYKDYILGFIFYKFLSDKEVAFLKKDGYEDADIQEHAHENNEQLVDYCNNTSVISSPTTTCFPLGWRRVTVSLSIMSEQLFLHSIV